jgi:hypothetical protein
MVEILVKCANCSQVIAADADYFGKQIRCPSCNGQISVAVQGITFACAACKQDLVASFSLAGTECECPKCDKRLRVPMRSEMPTSKRRLNQESNHTALSGVVLVGILVLGGLCSWGTLRKGNWLHRGKAISAPQASVSTNAGNKLHLDFFASQSESERFELLPAYEASVRTGAFALASMQLTAIRKTCTTPAEEALFWEKAMPGGHATELAVYLACAHCSTGACVRCGGEGICPACGGQGVCSSCKGVVPEPQQCKHCVCQSCGGQGKCGACRGKGKRSCSSCDGDGEIGKEISKNCPSCGGRGSKPGLRRADGTADALRCVRCRGSGVTKGTTLASCASCGGIGTIRCQSCQGAGKCATCAGAGRRSGCSVCNGRGTWVSQCETCGGVRSCPDCRGRSKCPQCEGNGICRECKGHGATNEYTLVVDSSWLKRETGYIALDETKPWSLVSGHNTGAVQIMLGSRPVTITVSQKQVACISEGRSFEWCRQHLLKWFYRL